MGSIQNLQSAVDSLTNLHAIEATKNPDDEYGDEYYDEEEGSKSLRQSKKSSAKVRKSKQSSIKGDKKTTKETDDGYGDEYYDEEEPSVRSSKKSKKNK